MTLLEIDRIICRMRGCEAKNLYTGTSRFVEEETGMDHPGIVEQQQAPLRKLLGKIDEVSGSNRPLIIDQQSGGIPLREWVPGYLFFRKMVIEAGYG